MYRIVCTVLLSAASLLSCGRADDGRADDGRGSQARDADVLLFSGTGTSPNDVLALETLLSNRRISYATADSGTLGAMSAARLREYKLLIVPGGNFEEMENGLTPAATTNVREAVHQGLNYFGICAGAFLAGDTPRNGINLTGLKFGFHPASSLGIRKAAVTISTPDGQKLEHYWEDGPELSGWGMVVAKYPDGKPAVAQGYVGYGWVILSGIHAEAPEDWRAGMTFKTPASESNAYAVKIIEAALGGVPLPHF